MSEHPIESLMKTAMESIKEMVDVNTVIGDPVETPGGIVIIPVSRVAVGFAAGGGEYAYERQGKEDESAYPFGGGSGAGVSVHPMGFLVVEKDKVRFIPVDKNVLAGRILDLAPEIIDRIEAMLVKDKSSQSTYEMETRKTVK